MKKILFSLMTMVLVIGMVGAGAFAQFFDTETSTGNTFTAGTLNLEVSGADPLVDKFTVTKTYGGDSGEKDWALKNTGDMAGSLDITFSNLVNDENGANEPEVADAQEDEASVCAVGACQTDGELAGVLDLLIYIDQVEDDTYVPADDQLVYDGFASGIIGQQLSDYVMAAGYAKSIRIEWSIAGGIDNEIQSDIAGFDIEFELLQFAD